MNTISKKDTKRKDKKDDTNADLLNDIVWGSRGFVNAQVIYKILLLIACYSQGECTLPYLLRFTHALLEQKKVKLYPELQKELEEFLQVENFLDNQAAITYSVDRLFQNITEGRIRKN